MIGGLLYTFGTVAYWMGVLFSVGCLMAVFRLLARTPGTESRKQALTALIRGVVAVVLLLIGNAFPVMRQVNGASKAINVPIVWFVMPFTAWLGFACLAMSAVNLVQRWLVAIEHASAHRLKSAAGWLLGAVAFWLLYRHDPKSQIVILRGAVGLSFTSILIILVLTSAGLASMVWGARSMILRGATKAAATHAALLIGSVVFGLPFVYLLSTSFKEDIDMASPNGIVWIPKVTETVPYLNPTDPDYQAQYNGSTVTGRISSKDSTGSVIFDIDTPLSLAGLRIHVPFASLKPVATQVDVVTAKYRGILGIGFVAENLPNGNRRVIFTSPSALKGVEHEFTPEETDPVREPGLKWQNYTDVFSYFPVDSDDGLIYLKNTMILVILGTVGTLLSSSIVGYAFSRMRFPGREPLFAIVLGTMMLPGAVTLLPQFLIFRDLGWIDSLKPLWVPAFFASAFNVFLLRQFFKQIPMELEDAAKIDGCGYLKTYWSIMMPQVSGALAVIAIWSFLGNWNNFMGPLIYVSSPEKMPLSYALQLFQGDHSGEPGVLMAFTTMCTVPVLLLFFCAQRYFVEGVQLSGLGGR